MPNAIASVVAFMGLQAFGVVPCLLNISTGAAAMLSACRTAGVRTVISSRAFVEKGRLTKIVERMAEEVRFVWLEDVRASIGLRAKLRARRDAWRARRLPGASTDPDAPAVVLFTSGSEGAPKGVVLSHRNLLANCAQIGSVIDFHGGDIVFNAMPMFHAFGLTGGTILPLVSGVRTFHYPTPLHYRIVPALIYDTDATICFGTDTFLNGWARYAHPYDFYAMRYIFAGAEKVREETRHLFADRFGVRILEGYGATETSPVLALNTAMQCRPGTVGRFMPGIDWRLEPVAGIETGGRLHVRGPNVMLGYLHETAPGVLEPPEDGWYDTGDIVSVDGAGFVTIVGRVKRFAKIGGEMVSMAAAEALAASLWPEAQHAVISLPDPRKGEVAAAGDDAAGCGQPGDPCSRKSADDSRDHGAARGAVRAVGSVAGHWQDRLSRRCSVWPKTHVPARRRKLYWPESPRSGFLLPERLDVELRQTPGSTIPDAGALPSSP